MVKAGCNSMIVDASVLIPGDSQTVERTWRKRHMVLNC